MLPYASMSVVGIAMFAFGMTWCVGIPPKRNSVAIAKLDASQSDTVLVRFITTETPYRSVEAVLPNEFVPDTLPAHTVVWYDPNVPTDVSFDPPAMVNQWGALVAGSGILLVAMACGLNAWLGVPPKN